MKLVPSSGRDSPPHVFCRFNQQSKQDSPEGKHLLGGKKIQMFSPNQSKFIYFGYRLHSFPGQPSHSEESFWVSSANSITQCNQFTPGGGRSSVFVSPSTFQVVKTNTRIGRFSMENMAQGKKLLQKNCT